MNFVFCMQDPSQFPKIEKQVAQYALLSELKYEYKICTEAAELWKMDLTEVDALFLPVASED